MLAAHYTSLGENKVQCLLCPHQCVLKHGQTGVCRVRKNQRGKLVAEAYQLYSSMAFDPIEKKPLYHFYPGREILSVGSYGCNMRCQWCQNCEISQKGMSQGIHSKHFTVQQLYELACSRPANVGIAFTYNEPSVAYETIMEVANYFSKRRLKTAMVTNGYFGQEALKDYLQIIDTFNVDVKAFNDKVHRKYTLAELSVVKENLVTIYKSGRHLEVTCLIVPGVNDKEDEFVEFLNWYVHNLSDWVPLHLSRYFPHNLYQAPPTPEETLEKFAQIASERLKFVYMGNVGRSGYSDTHCPSCGIRLIERHGYNVRLVNANSDGSCASCSTPVFFCAKC
ncbi:MAG: AmmeMemoRadiSam system radical SAM enzyme [Bacteroidota bacterium]|nr:MAG: AmmeMemoRadiSam system radical SAM enzyme [Bacteroidota bacterium]